MGPGYLARGATDFDMLQTAILILPGYADSGPDHWQSHWERADPAFRRVVQDDWLQPRLADWLVALDRRVAACATPPVLVAHSLACSLVAHWAARTRAAAKGALLVAPADVDSPAHTPEEVRSFSPIPLVRLPFPSTVVASTDDPFVTLERAAALAHAWGSRLVTLERGGHVNADAGYGPWPEGRRWLDELLTGHS
jgi:predicted alpha/beta hydrolase family esterase